MGTLLSPASGSLKIDLIQRVYIPKGPPNPTSYVQGLGGVWGLGFIKATITVEFVDKDLYGLVWGAVGLGFQGLGFRGFVVSC